MKKLTFLFTFFLLTTSLSAQIIEAGDKRRDWGWQQQSKIYNFFGFSTERGVADNVSIGFSLMISNPGGFETTNIFFVPTIKGNYYFNDLLNLDNDNIDLYAGLGVNKVLNISDNVYSAKQREYVIGLNNIYPVGVQLNVGSRYFLGGNFGFKGELSLGSSGLSAATFGLFISRKK